ncbi:hypothetical protein PW52_00935 [Tamlana sedimentorum]|uniref:Uncharacterized protein n=1 Tax=Neotamlana sedimentorum TaxID=1435349 RepID=A0A0D7WD13_9FLAO|nr:hypothetical protein [Tamlana sedimentorum]KJD37055.1 hypothetical protein PW52_00935 [Tamlana sedimentorum]
MKSLTLIVLIGLGTFFVIKLKPEPKIIEFKKTMATKGCIAPYGLITDSTKHKACCNIKGRAYYIVTQKH